MSSASSQTAETARRKILVVEDEPTLADAVLARLNAAGFATAYAATGPAAVTAAREEQPDALVLDVMLPGFDGLEVCRRLQAERPVPVLMLTARDAESDLLAGLGAGADDYLTKPFDIGELVARLHALLRRSSHSDEHSDAMTIGPLMMIKVSGPGVLPVCSNP